MKARLGIVMSLGLASLLAGCGPFQPGPSVPPSVALALAAAQKLQFTGGTITASAVITDANGQPLKVTASTVSTAGTVVPTTVTQSGSTYTLTIVFPANATTSSITYTVTATADNGVVQARGSLQVVQPGVTAPVIGGGTTSGGAPSGPVIPDLSLRG